MKNMAGTPPPSPCPTLSRRPLTEKTLENLRVARRPDTPCPARRNLNWSALLSKIIKPVDELESKNDDDKSVQGCVAKRSQEIPALASNVDEDEYVVVDLDEVDVVETVPLPVIVPKPKPKSSGAGDAAAAAAAPQVNAAETESGSVPIPDIVQKSDTVVPTVAGGGAGLKPQPLLQTTARTPQAAATQAPPAGCKNVIEGGSQQPPAAPGSSSLPSSSASSGGFYFTTPGLEQQNIVWMDVLARSISSHLNTHISQIHSTLDFAIMEFRNSTRRYYAVLNGLGEILITV